MESFERREARRARRWLAALRRAGYILFIAYLFRFTNTMGSWPKLNLQELLKVDILNCMGLAMAVFALAAIFDFEQRVRFAIGGALAVAAAAPLVSGLDWSGVPTVVKFYLVPGPDRGQFPFFPCAAYLGFGLAVGSLVKRTVAERMDRLMQWAVLIGFTLIFAAEYFANLPYSVYAASDFWRNSPALILIRVGIALLLLAGAYLWTERLAGPGWSWLRTFGQASLLVYWVHVVMVYGDLAGPLKRSLTPAWSAAAFVAITILMVALAEARLRYKARRSTRWKALTTVAGAAEA